MLLFTLAILLGDLILQFLPNLPSFNVMIMVIISIISLMILIRQKNVFIFFLGLLIGFTWTYFYALQTLNFVLPKEIENKPVQIIGYIKSIPKQTHYGSHFEFHLLELDTGHSRYFPNVDVALSASSKSSQFHVAEKWHFTAKLKRIHGLQSPGAFDYERSLFSKGLRIQGQVKDQLSSRLEDPKRYRYPITQIREFLKYRFQEYSSHHALSPWLLALMIGEREMIPAQDWEILRKTGTNHLMAIAGLHVGLLTHLMQKMSFILWKQSAWLLRCLPALEASLYFGLLSGVSYAMLSGFLLPTQRAAMMLIVSVVLMIKYYRSSVWYPWVSALLFVLLLNPLSVLSDSFVIMVYLL